jgi:hypothetical protein
VGPADAFPPLPPPPLLHCAWSSPDWYDAGPIDGGGPEQEISMQLRTRIEVRAQPISYGDAMQLGTNVVALGLRRDRAGMLKS